MLPAPYDCRSSFFTPGQNRGSTCPLCPPPDSPLKLNHFYGWHWNNVKCLIFVLAGIHHLILDQNRLAIKQDLVIGDRMNRLWQKASSKKEFSTTTRDKTIESFIEWLQMQPLKDYKHFIRLLNNTKQERLAAQLVGSCKII